MNQLTLLLLLQFAFLLSVSGQGLIEAEEVRADSLRGVHIGDGSRLIGLPNQNLVVSISGDTLHITEGKLGINPGT